MLGVNRMTGSGWRGTPGGALGILAPSLLAMALAVASCGQGEPKEPQAPVGGTVGNLAPDFSLPDLAGAAVRLSDYRGKVVILSMWAATCRNCLGPDGDLSALQALHERYTYPGSGVVVLAPNFYDLLSQMLTIREDAGYSLRMLHDRRQVLMRDYRIASLPTMLTYIIDQLGIIRYREERVDVPGVQRIVDGLTH